jgi:YNFM family putative membrane transporter
MGHKTLLALVTVGGLTGYISRMLIPPLLHIIQEEFSISHFQAGLLMTGFMGGYALAQIPSGLLGEKVGFKKIIFLAMAGTSISTLLIGFSTNYIQVLILRIIFGVCAGNYYTPATCMLAQKFTEENRGFAQGCLMMGVPAGTAIAPLIAVSAHVLYGWRASFVIASVPGFMATVLFYWYAKDEKTSIRVRDQFIWSSHIFIIGIASFFTGCAVFGFLTFFPEFLLEIGFTVERGAFLFFVLSLAGVAAVPILGTFSDRVGRLKVILGLFTILMPVFAGFLFLFSNPFWIFGLVICAGIILYGYVPPLMALVADLSPEKARGFWVGYLNTMAFAGGAFGSAAGGIILDYSTFTFLFLFFIGTVFIGVMLHIGRVHAIPPVHQ